MHEDQRSLKGIVDGVIGRICNGLGSHLLPPHFEIVIPKLVTVHVCVMENKHKHALYDLTQMPVGNSWYLPYQNSTLVPIKTCCDNWTQRDWMGESTSCDGATDVKCQLNLFE